MRRINMANHKERYAPIEGWEPPSEPEKESKAKTRENVQIDIPSLHESNEAVEAGRSLNARAEFAQVLCQEFFRRYPNGKFTLSGAGVANTAYKHLGHDAVTENDWIDAADLFIADCARWHTEHEVAL
jgi:hypothetical protein